MYAKTKRFVFLDYYLIISNIYANDLNFNHLHPLQININI